MRDHAIAYAAAGYPVFPCVPRGKCPVCAHGLSEATTDPDQVRAWWKATPNANIGFRVDGHIIIDVDGPEGVTSLRDLAQHIGEPLPRCPANVTRRGWHLVYRLPAGVGATIPNRARVRPGIDTRIDNRGYIIAPPSVHESGHRYTWWADGPPLHEAPLLPAGWATGLARARRKATTVAAPPRPTVGGLSRYGLGALTAILDELRAAQEGGRNDSLYHACRRILEITDAGHLPDAEEPLRHAEQIALHLGLTQHEIDSTMGSARDGHKQKAAVA